jgi:hypothetical protein
MKKIVLALIACLFVWCIPSAYGQGKCTLETLAGTYAIYERGANSVLDPTPLEQAPFHFSGVTAPFVNVTQITFTPYGQGDGFFWIKVGTLDGGLEPIPVHITITEMNADCTGKLEYEINLPPIPPTTIQERFLVMDNGREFRSVPISMGEGGIATLAWVGYGRRVEDSCGPHSARGTYVFTCENLIATSPTMAVADSTLFHVKVAPDGSYKGRLYEKIGPLSIDTPVVGTFAVNKNCSFSHTLQVPEYFGSETIDSRGLFFNNGNEFYLLPMVGSPNPGFCQGKRVGLAAQVTRK